MKRIATYITLALVAAMACSCAGYKVYPVKSKPLMPVKGGLMYALPKTMVCVAVTFEKRDYAEAPFAEFAQEMLGLDKLDVQAPFAIDNITVEGVNEADPRHYYFIDPRGLSVVVDSRHLLRSVGVDQEDLKEFDSYNERRGSYSPDNDDEDLVPQNNLYDRTDTFYVRGDRKGHPSLVSSKKDSRNIRQRAIAAAERLEELQNKRQQLLYGEYEGSYTPEGIKYLVDQLAEQEERILSQFLGRTRRETVRFYIEPRDEKTMIDSQSVVLFGFSPQKGLCSRENIEAGMDTVRCIIRCENTLRSAARFVKFRTSGRRKDDNVGNRNTFKYRQAETATVTVFGSQFSFETEVKVAQFGPVVDLPRRKFQAIFDARTGDLLFYKN